MDLSWIAAAPRSVHVGGDHGVPPTLLHEVKPETSANLPHGMIG